VKAVKKVDRKTGKLTLVVILGCLIIAIILFTIAIFAIAIFWQGLLRVQGGF
jgi:hypothetical protein